MTPEYQLLTTPQLEALIEVALTPDTARRIAQRRSILRDASAVYGDWAAKLRQRAVEFAATKGRVWQPISADLRIREALQGPMSRQAAEGLVIALRNLLEADGH
jgi:hypothetical protein